MDSNQGEPFKVLVEQIKRNVSIMEIRDGKMPTFETYIYEMIEEGTISMDNLEKDIRAIALGWSGARLGATNWKFLYKQINEEFSSTYNAIFMDSKNMENDGKTEENKTTQKTFSIRLLNIIREIFEIIDSEIIRLIKKLGTIPILILLVGLYVTRYLLIEYVSSYIYRDIEDEMYDLYIVISIISIIYILFLDGKTKNNVLTFIKYFLLPYIIIYLIIVGLILLILEFI